MPQTTSFTAGGGLDDLLASVPAGWTTRLETGRTSTATFYDTFDWRVYRHGARLSCQEERGRYRATLLDDGLPIEQILETEPSFVREFSDGPLRSRLAPIVSIRRLLPVVRVRRQPRTIQVLNEDGKIVARLGADELAAAPLGKGRWIPVADRWQVIPLRGYETEAEILERGIEALTGLGPDPRSELDHVLAAIGRVAESYSSKFRLELAPETPAGIALRAVLAMLLETLRANEPGTIADLDPEFLHDFRVAVRRTRSCIGQMKRALPMKRVEPFRAEFAWLGTASGPTRDLDVFLLDLERWGRKLPQESRDSLEPLRTLVRQDQRGAQETLATQLRSRRYRGLLAEWSAFLETPPETDEAPHSQMPIGEAAEQRIRIKFENIVRKGRKLEVMPSASGLHRLRIEGKKLRYLLEFFRSLFPDDAVRPLVTALKRLQDNLGEFNDLQVQQEALKSMIPRLQAIEEIPVETLVTVGRLLERLTRREQVLRRDFLRQFEHFAGRETRALIGRLTSARVRA